MAGANFTTSAMTLPSPCTCRHLLLRSWSVLYGTSTYRSHRAFCLISAVTDRAVMARFLAFSSFRDFFGPPIRSLEVNQEATSQYCFKCTSGLALTLRNRLAKYHKEVLTILISSNLLPVAGIKQTARYTTPIGLKQIESRST